MLIHNSYSILVLCGDFSLTVEKTHRSSGELSIRNICAVLVLFSYASGGKKTADTKIPYRL
ncbi:MAG: hypothetical protein KDD49_05470 [Bacteroidetes bacterium]|nr:hypothetical protein [Bacteroidota bacterium]MCB9042369.1 hypothetical protein [Chitinophagales bacterium]